MTESEIKCGVCGLPMHPLESGVRHFGFYVAHSEDRCISLLRGRIAELEALTVQGEGNASSGNDFGRGSTGWRPIDSAPRDGTEVLLLIGDVVHAGSWSGPSDGAIYARRPNAYDWFSMSDGSTHCDRFVTHWMPLPDPPATPANETGEG
jgi:hypothetical protein